jgi:hypothetical protein
MRTTDQPKQDNNKQHIYSTQAHLFNIYVTHKSR